MLEIQDKVFKFVQASHKKSSLKLQTGQPLQNLSCELYPPVLYSIMCYCAPYHIQYPTIKAQYPALQSLPQYKGRCQKNPERGGKPLF